MPILKDLETAIAESEKALADLRGSVACAEWSVAEHAGWLEQEKNKFVSVFELSLENLENLPSRLKKLAVIVVSKHGQTGLSQAGKNSCLDNE